MIQRGVLVMAGKFQKKFQKGVKEELVRGVVAKNVEVKEEKGTVEMVAANLGESQQNKN